jgi:hypothetical protein
MGRGAAATADFKTKDVEGEMHLPVVDLSAPEHEAAATLQDACINHGFYYLAGWVAVRPLFAGHNIAP